MLGGLVKGLSGFGYAVVSTALLASFFPAPEAVAFLIIPLMAVQLELLSELGKEEIKTCTRNFEAYIIALLAGTLAGFYMISAVPEDPVKIFLGVLTLIFALSSTGRFDLHVERLKERCFRRSSKVQLTLGFFSGLIFGSTNIGVQIVAYLKSMEMERRKFVGLLALVMIPISGLRLPLLSSGDVLISSLVVAPIAMISAKTGLYIGERTSGNLTENVTVLLLIAVSLNLVLNASKGI
jgi:uncharacterized membrane protein YfcA